MQANNAQNNVNPNINNSNQGISKTIQEDPNVVAQKGNRAVKILADNVGDMYSKKLISEGKLQDQTANLLQTQGDRTLKQLAELIAEKYRFGRLPNKQPVQQNNGADELARQRAQLEADRNALNREMGKYQDERIGDFLLNGANQRGSVNMQYNDGRRSHVVQERRLDQVIRTNVYENNIGHVTGGHFNANAVVSVVHEEGVLRNNVIDKTFEVIVEKPVVREIIVEKPYDVIVERPVENRIEKEIITEQYIDNPIERIIENPVERIINKHVERVIEKPIISERIVEKRIENFVDNYVDVVREVQVPYTTHVDKHINRTIVKPYRKEITTREVVVDEPIYEDVYVDKQVQRVVERFVDIPETEYVEREYVREVDVPVVTDVIKEIRVSRPVQKIIDVPDIQRVKKSIVVQKVVERPYEVVTEIEKPVRRTVRREVEVPVYVDKVVNVPVDRIIEKPFYVEKKIEVPVTVEIEKFIDVERYEDVMVEEIREVPVHVEKIVEIEVPKHVAKYVEVPREIYKDVPITVEVQIPIEVDVERSVRVEKRMPRRVEVEKIVEVPVDRYVDKMITIDKVVEKPVFVEKFVDRPVQRIVERVVEVPVEKIVQVPREIKKDKIIEVSTIVEKPVYIEREVNDGTDITVVSRNDRIKRDIRKSVDVLTTLQREEQEWRRRLEESKLRFKLTEFSTQHVESTIGFEENQNLRQRLDYLHEEYNTVIDKQNRIKTEGVRSSVRVTGVLGARREVTELNSSYAPTHVRKSVGAVNNMTNYNSINRSSQYVTRVDNGPSRVVGTQLYDQYGNVIERNTATQGQQWTTSSNVYTTHNSNTRYVGGSLTQSNYNRVYVTDIVRRVNASIITEADLARINIAIGKHAEELSRMN